MARLSPTALLFSASLVFAALVSAPAAWANEPPVIVAPAEMQRDPGQLLAFNVSTSDPDGDRVTLEAANLPLGSTFRLDGNGNGLFIWTAADADEGFYTVTLIATDDGLPALSTMVDVLLTIGEPNTPPMLDPIGDQEAIVGRLLSFPLAASDADGDLLVFSTDPILGGTVLLDYGDGTGLFEFTPSTSHIGNQVLTFVVSDGVDTAEETIVITVGDVNMPPVLQAIGDRQLTLGDSLDIALMATDPDGDTLAFEALDLPAGVDLTDRGDGTAVLSGTPEVDGLYTVTVTVMDDGDPQESAAETFDIDVLPAPDESDLVIFEARWKRRDLEIAGQGALPSAPVQVHDAMTGAMLGELVADKDGAFAGKLRPFVPPCAAQVRSDDQESEAMPVTDAPKSCSQGPPTRVLMALWSCHGGLYVVGHRAPAHATIRIYDADTGETLAVTKASRWGYFLLRSHVAEQPVEIRASVEADGVEWMLEPTSVRSHQNCHDHRSGHWRNARGWWK